jgi:hypothetical protein
VGTVVSFFVWSLLASFPEPKTPTFACHSLISLLNQLDQSYKTTSTSWGGVNVDLDATISDLAHLLALISKEEADLFFERLKESQSTDLDKDFGKHFIAWLRLLDQSSLKQMHRIFKNSRSLDRNSKAFKIRDVLSMNLPQNSDDRRVFSQQLIEESAILRNVSKKIETVTDSEGRFLISKLKQRNLIHWNRSAGEAFWKKKQVPLDSVQNQKIPLLFAITLDPLHQKFEMFVAIDPESRDFESEKPDPSLEYQINFYTIHSQVARGQDVIFSGVLWINLEGEVAYATLESGHYMLGRIKRIEEKILSHFSGDAAYQATMLFAERDRETLAQLLIERFRLKVLDFERLSDRFFVRRSEWLSLFP